MKKQEVKHVAKLAALKLTPKEVNKYQKQLTETLDYVNQLDELETKKVESTSQVTGLENVLRKDKPGLSLSVKEALANAPQKHHHFFKIKAIFKR